MKRRIILIVSLVAGLIGAVLTKAYLTAREGDLRKQQEALYKRYGSMTVLCFGRDTPANTVLSKSDLAEIRVPALGLRGQALTKENLDDVLGRKTLVSHAERDVLFWADIEGGDPKTKTLSSDVKREMRAMSVNVTGAATVSGMVRPNDHVDVIGTFDFPDPSGLKRKGDFVTCTILQNVLVLATGKMTAKSRPVLYGAENSSSTGYSTVTLEVTPREAEMLAFAEQMKGRLILTLRNRNDTSFERELPEVNFEKIREEIGQLNLIRQKEKVGGRR